MQIIISYLHWHHKYYLNDTFFRQWIRGNRFTRGILNKILDISLILIEFF